MIFDATFIATRASELLVFGKFRSPLVAAHQATTRAIERSQVPAHIPKKVLVLLVADMIKTYGPTIAG